MFAVEPGRRDELIEKTCQLLKKDTLSEKTAIAVLDGFKVPKILRTYAEDTKKSMMTVKDAEKTAKEVGVQLVQVTGSPGEIGALAALGLYNDLKEAVKVYY